ncbi:hypothetical protein [Larkinella rosea]|uniref:Uncharacterized protein n=1 Tax=Larkinella rosea TaxID=2025312 RepID=A0A3P1BM36_9BACT|nr:hypothetical protein [Larkinella rosea]RRB02099.1 hypothetical protein EHT25_16575 [Larkinella rosea]
MIKRLAIGLWSLLLVACLPALAQFEPSARLELPISPNTEEFFDVTTLGDQGLLLNIRQSDYYSSAPTKFLFRRLDTNFKQLWANEYKIDPFYEPVRSCRTEQYVYWLLKETQNEKVAVMRVHLADGVIETFKGDLVTPMDIFHFKVLDNVAYLGGYYRSRPVVVSFSFFDLTSKVLPGLYTNHIQLNNIEVDEERRLVHVMTDATHQRNCEFTVRTYSYEGKLVRTVNLDGRAHSLISGKLLPINDEESLLVGNYSNDCTPYSQGVYMTRIRNSAATVGASETGENMAITPTEDTRFIDFSELQNFFNYMKPKRQQKLLERLARRKDQGKDTKFRYRLLVHDLVPTDEGLMLLAEVYYPQYRGGAYPYLGSGRAYDRYQEGYRYTHAFLCGFDKKGKLLWDNSLSIPDLSSYDLHQMVQVVRHGNSTVLAYPHEGEITAEVIQGGKVVKVQEKYSLKKLGEHEKVVYSENDQLEAWYDGHFLACGIQKISTERSMAPPREVFYINKVTCNFKDLNANPANWSSNPEGGNATRKTSESKQ